MRAKHLAQRIASCLQLSEVSNCPRKKFGCIILDGESNIILSDGYNGATRGSCGDLCGGSTCLRDTMGIKSGTNHDIGCVHAEMNAIFNAARKGIAIKGSWLFINGEPCYLCAKAIVQVGITRVFCISDVYPIGNGVEFLESHNIKVHKILDINDLEPHLAEL